MDIIPETMKPQLLVMNYIILLTVQQYLLCMAGTVRDVKELQCSSNTLYNVHCSWLLPNDNPISTTLKVCLAAVNRCRNLEYFKDVECYPTIIQDNRTCHCDVNLIQFKRTTYPSYDSFSNWQALKFAVFASNSQRSDPFTFKWKYQAKPKAPPRDIIIRAMNHTALSVSWTCPEGWSENDSDVWKEDISDDLLEYQLNYTKENRSETMEVGMKRHATISHIGAYTTSCVKLRTRNSLILASTSWSNWSEPVCCRTKEGVPEKVTGLQMTNFEYFQTINNVSTTVKWDALDKSQWKGGSMTYFITVCAHRDTSSPCHNESTKNNSIKTELQSNMSYAITVRAFNGRNSSYSKLTYQIEPHQQVMIQSLPAQARVADVRDPDSNPFTFNTLLACLLVVGGLLTTIGLTVYYRIKSNPEFDIPIPNLNPKGLINNNDPLTFRVVTPEDFDELSNDEGQYINLGVQNTTHGNAHVDRARDVAPTSVINIPTSFNERNEEQHGRDAETTKPLQNPQADSKTTFPQESATYISKHTLTWEKLHCVSFGETHPEQISAGATIAHSTSQPIISNPNHESDALFSSNAVTSTSHITPILQVNYDSCMKPSLTGIYKESSYVSHSSIPQGTSKHHSSTSIDTNKASFPEHYVKSSILAYSCMTTLNSSNGGAVPMVTTSTKSRSGSSTSHSEISQNNVSSVKMALPDGTDTNGSQISSSSVDISKKVHSNVFNMAVISTSKCSESLQSPYVPLASMPNATTQNDPSTSAISCPDSVNTNASLFTPDSLTSSVIPTTSPSFKYAPVLETYSSNSLLLDATNMSSISTEIFHRNTPIYQSSACKALTNIPISKRKMAVSSEKDNCKMNILEVSDDIVSAMSPTGAYKSAISSQDFNQATLTTEGNRNDSVDPADSYVKAAIMFQSSICQETASSEGDHSPLLPQNIPMSPIQIYMSPQVPLVLESLFPSSLVSDKQEESLNQKFSGSTISSFSDHNPDHYLQHSAVVSNSNSNNTYNVDGDIAASDKNTSEYTKFSSNVFDNVTQDNLPAVCDDAPCMDAFVT